MTALCRENAPTLLCGACYTSLNSTYFHLKDPVLKKAKIFVALLLVALYILACPCSFDNKETVPLQTYFVGAT